MNEIINKLKELNLTDIKIELIGSWIWLTGDTFNLKDKFKEIGFLYSGSKKAWFYNGSNKKINLSFCKDLNEIRNKFLTKELN